MLRLPLDEISTERLERLHEGLHRYMDAVQAADEEASGTAFAAYHGELAELYRRFDEALEHREGTDHDAHEPTPEDE